MKVYDYQWSASFGHGCRDRRGELVRDGIDTVLVRNQIDPLPTSGVDQEAYLASAVSATAGHGSRLVGCAARGRTPRLPDDGAVLRPRAPAVVSGRATSRRERRSGRWIRLVSRRLPHPRRLPGGQDRSPATRRRRVGTGRSLSVVHALPGFWENWVPGYAFTDADRFCFCPRCRARFAADLDLDLAPGDAATQARVILEEHGVAWTAWRARRIVAVIDAHRRRGSRRAPDLEIMLNTLPFPAVRLRRARCAAGDRGAGSRRCCEGRLTASS